MTQLGLSEWKPSPNRQHLQHSFWAPAIFWACFSGILALPMERKSVCNLNRAFKCPNFWRNERLRKSQEIYFFQFAVASRPLGPHSYGQRWHQIEPLGLFVENNCRHCWREEALRKAFLVTTCEHERHRKFARLQTRLQKESQPRTHPLKTNGRK